MSTIDNPVSISETDRARVIPQQSTNSLDERQTQSQKHLWGNEVRIPPKVSAEPGDGVNRFLLCVLVSRTAKFVKARAERAGESLPMAAIVKSVLHSYRTTAKRVPGVLAGSELNLERLRSLLENIMKEEVRHYAQEIVKSNRARLAHANKVGDEIRIKAETEALERTIASSNRLTTEFK